MLIFVHFVIGTALQVAIKEMEQKLQADLNTAKHMSRAKDQQISVLEQEVLKLKSRWKSITTESDGDQSSCIYCKLILQDDCHICSNCIS